MDYLLKTEDLLELLNNLIYSKGDCLPVLIYL